MAVRKMIQSSDVIRTKDRPNPHRGSILDDFLADEGILDEVTECAIEAVFDAIARDPTGTDDLRRAFERELKDRWQRLDKCLYKAIGTLDSLGLAQGPLALIPAADRMKHFRSWLDELLSHLIVSGGDWMATYLDEAGERASSRAASLDPRKAAGGSLPTAPRIAGHDAYDPDEPRNKECEWNDALLVLATSELQGICDAVSQQASRLVAHCVLIRARPTKAAQGIRQLIATVGLQRSKMMADYLVVKAHACATLVAFREAGVTHVGTVAEMLPQVLGDASPEDEPRDDQGRWTSLVNALTATGWDFHHEEQGAKVYQRAGHGLVAVTPAGTWHHSDGPSGKSADSLEHFLAVAFLSHMGGPSRYKKPDHITDAARKTPQHQHPTTGKFITKAAATREWGRRGSGKFGKAPKTYNRSIAHRKALRAAKSFGEEEVNVQTAGDDRVCATCQAISDNGPYPIDTAMDLIPNHPRCRCVYVPAGVGAELQRTS